MNSSEKTLQAEVLSFDPQSPDIVGDTPVYDAAGRRLLWVDAQRGQVHELNWSEDGTHRRGRSWQIGAFVAAVVPRAGGGFVAATASHLVVVSDDGPDYDKTYPAVSTVLTSLPNEGRPRLKNLACDPRGRLFAGVCPDDHSGPAQLTRLEPDGSFESVFSGIPVLGGCGWSPDGSTLYLSDIFGRTIEAFDYDVAAGTVENRRTAATIEPELGFPYGFTVDEEGCLWVAVVYGGVVRRYSPEGELLASVRTPTVMSGACTFGGPDGGDLLITSWWLTHGRGMLDELGIGRDRSEASLRDEHGGGLFTCRPGVCGPPSTPFAG
jgi:sugar lactone lactonase YvrE